MPLGATPWVGLSGRGPDLSGMHEPSTADALLRRAADATALADARVETVAAGRHLTFVACETGDGERLAGVALDPGDPLPDVAGARAEAVVEDGIGSDDRGRRAVAVATLNAVAGRPPEAVAGDPFAALDPAVDRVAMVGFFGPVLRQVADVRVDVFERDPEAMAVPDDLPESVDVTLHAPEDAPSVVPEATVLYVTGSTLVYGGIETYLEAVRPGQSVVVVGASASFSPRVFFAAGVSVVAGAAVTDRERVQRAIVAGDSEAGLHGNGLEKWLAVDPDADALPGLRLAD